jgi:hypothetical protein
MKLRHELYDTLGVDALLIVRGYACQSHREPFIQLCHCLPSNSSFTIQKKRDIISLSVVGRFRDHLKMHDVS